jgi:hypothetical protein
MDTDLLAIPREEVFSFKHIINDFAESLLPKSNTENGEKQKYIKGAFSDPVKKQLTNLIFALQIPEKWKQETISPPTVFCKEIAERVTKSIYSVYRLIPQRISPTIEEGIFISYKNFDNNRSLSIEIYNDSDIAAIVTHEKRIIKVTDIQVFLAV